MLQDTKTVVGKLELVVGVIIHIIFIFFYLIIFNVSCTFLVAKAVCWKGSSCNYALLDKTEKITELPCSPFRSAVCKYIGLWLLVPTVACCYATRRQIRPTGCGHKLALFVPKSMLMLFCHRDFCGRACLN